MTWHKSVGVLKYSSYSRLVVEVDPALGEYYYSLIPKSKYATKPRYASHITVVRPDQETPVHREHWGKYEGEQVEFLYSPVVHYGKIYYWLDVLCLRLEDIRFELGLPIWFYNDRTPPPDGYGKFFHITLGNTKHEQENLAHI